MLKELTEKDINRYKYFKNDLSIIELRAIEELIINMLQSYYSKLNDTTNKKDLQKTIPVGSFKFYQAPLRSFANTIGNDSQTQNNYSSYDPYGWYNIPKDKDVDSQTTIKSTPTKECPTCDGHKQKWDSDTSMMKNCETCHGSGKV